MSKPFAKIKEIKAGDYVRTDGGFTCIGSNQIREVKVDEAGFLYFDCNEGQHGLAWQIGYQKNTTNRYVGLFKHAGPKTKISLTPKDKP